MPKTSINFIIVCPPFNRISAGNVVLHELAHEIYTHGYNAFIVIRHGPNFYITNQGQFFSPALKRTHYKEESADELIRLLKNSIVIYPEIITDNPLNAKNVVRYFLYFDGKHTGTKVENAPSDYIVTYSRIFRENYHQVLYKPVCDLRTKFVNTERTLDVTYIDEKEDTLNKKPFRIDQSLLISKQWPQSNTELKLLLNSTRHFYTWSPISSTNLDAILCGATPVFINPTMNELEQLDGMEAGYFPYKTAVFLDRQMVIEDRDDFNLLRTQYLERLNQHQDNWGSTVNLFCENALSHFMKA